MRKLLITLALISVVACKKKEEPSVVESLSTLNNMSKSMDEVNTNTEKLKNTTPISTEDLKKAVPESLVGIKREEITVTDMASIMKTVNAEALYKSDDQKSITLNIMDGAGEAASAVLSLQLLGLSANIEKTTATGFEKTTEINGMKALVSENKGTDYVESQIQFVAKNRYLITLSGNHVSYEELEKAAKELNLSALK